MIMSLNARCRSVMSQLVILVLVISVVGCKKSEKNAASEFASPAEAGNALLQAGKSGDQNALLAIFGSDSKDIISSGDTTQDKTMVSTFVTAYGTMHRWRKTGDDTQTLLVGADNYPFPIPLKKKSSGKWFFDSATGRDEVLARRIGRNELAVIDISVALAEAQVDYFSQPRGGERTKQYATKFISDAGKQNGLYWESPAGQPKSPLGPAVALATAEGYSAKPDSHGPFHGYYFRLLSQQGSHAPGGAKNYLVDGKMVGGFAFVAYPAEYRNSGVMTFIIDQDGVVLQKDLGQTTTETATAMSTFDPDASWSQVQE
jgi:hypothetical protein